MSGGAMIAGVGPCSTRGYKCDDPGIYSTTGLSGMPIYIMGGVNDDLVLQYAVEEMATWFSDQGATVTEYYPTNVAHSYPNALPATDENPSVTDCTDGYENCGDDIAGKYLANLLGVTLNSWNVNYNDNGQLYEYDASPYKNRWGSDTLDYGFIYIPDACLSASCPLHIFFHGCGGTAKWVGTDNMRKTGLLEHASANDIVVIFP